MDRKAWDQLWQTEPGTHDEPDRYLVSELENLVPGTALDLGCGPGANSHWLAQQGWQVTGVDWSEAAITQARKAASELGLAVTFEVADAARWSPPHSFALVISTYALPPRGDARDGVLKGAAAAVAPGGTFFVIEFDASSEAEMFSADDYVSLDELPRHLDGSEIARAEVVAVDHHSHGEGHEAPPGLRGALVRARRRG